MSPAVGLLVVVIGALVFTQVTMGGLVDRLMSYAEPDKEPASSGPKGSVHTPTRAQMRKALRVAPTALRGDPIVFDTIAPACEAAGGGFIVTSWYRPNAVTTSGNASCHRHGPGSGAGALDIQPVDRNWRRLDRLDQELRQTPGVQEIVWRGDPDHDPAAGASGPHLHVAVNCG